MIQEKLEELESYFAYPGTEINRTYAHSHWCRQHGIPNNIRDGEHCFWMIQVGERLGLKKTFYGNTVEEAVDAALDHFRKRGRDYGRPERRR